MKSSLLINFILFFTFSTILYVYVIPYLRKIKFGQNVRTEGLTSHYKKNGTPTMGGIVIIICSILFYSLLLIEYRNSLLINYHYVILIILSVVIYGVIGYIDDYLIVSKRNNKGLSPIIKLLLELIFGVIFYYLYLTFNNNPTLNFFGINVDVMFLYGLLIVFLFMGVTNSTNFTDGVDGLLAGSSVISYLAIGIVGIYKEEYSVVLFAFAVIVCLLSFLVFNLPVASLFMGNVGSLAIGAGMVASSIILRVELLLIFIGFVYLFETISVILQVYYYKRTHGKRLFRMTPFHHHLELSKFSEIEIDLSFYIIQIVMCAIGILIGIEVF